MKKILSSLIFGSLFILSLGLLTSVSMLAVSHILIAIPCLYFLFKTNWKSQSKSTWALIAMTIVLIVSVIFNQDIIIKGYSGVFKTKYFVIGILSIAPFSWYLLTRPTQEQRDKKISFLLYTICIGATIATIAGLIGQYTGYNPLLMKEIPVGRNAGLFGQIMNYAHNMSYLLIILLGLAFNKKEAKKYIDYRFLIIVLIINLVGFYFSYTRGAWLALLVGFPFFFLGNLKSFLKALMVTVALALIAYSFAGSNVERQDSDNTRIGLWQAGLEMFKNKPAIGYGFYNYSEHTVEIKKKHNFSNPSWAGHAHNNIVEIFASAGLLGGLSFLLWISFWFYEMLRRNDLVGKVSVAFIIAFFIGGLTQSTIILGPNLFFIMAIYSLTQVSNRILKQ